MKRTEKAPDWQSALKNLSTDAPFPASVIRKANADYMYWDDFKYQSLPEGMRHEQAWGMLKLTRLMSMKPVADCADAKGNAFSFWVPDSLSEDLHYLTQQASGQIATGGPSDINDEDRERYIVRSLTEEAISSSQIEGAATTRAVAREMIRTERAPTDKDERMIFNNYRAMRRIAELARQPLSVEMLRELHGILSEGTLEKPEWEGAFRTGDEEVHVIDPENRVLHHGLPASTIPGHVAALCRFSNDDAGDFIHPVVKAAILHFWLACIHPFMDGNGRLARALFFWYALRKGYWLFQYLSVSKAILKAKAQYYRAFLYAETDDGDMTYFIVYHVRAVRKAIEDLNEYIEKQKREAERIQALARQAAIRYEVLNHRQRVLLADAVGNMDRSYTIEVHAHTHGVVHATARTDLLGLERFGLMKKSRVGKQFRFTPAPDLMKRLGIK